jgi:hypothetical protein
MAGSAFANGFPPNVTLEYDDFDNRTKMLGTPACRYDWQSGTKLCINLIMIIDGNWTEDRVMNNLNIFKTKAKRFSSLSIRRDNWLFVEKVEAKLGNKKFKLSGKFTRRVVVGGGYVEESVLEPVDVYSDVYKNFWNPLDSGQIEKGTPIKIRVTGENYYIDYNFEV